MAADGKANGAVVPPFVHLDVQSTYGALASPSSPEDYVRALVAQSPLDRLPEGTPRPAIALADTGLHAAVKMAVASRSTNARLGGALGQQIPGPWAELGLEFLGRNRRAVRRTPAGENAPGGHRASQLSPSGPAAPASQSERLGSPCMAATSRGRVCVVA